MAEDGWGRFNSTQPVINRTYCYLFPVIGLCAKIPRENFIGLKAVFLLNDDYPDLHDVLYLVFRKINDRRSELIKETLRNEYNFYSEYSPDNFHSIIIMRIPTEYYLEYDKFLDSRYSELSERYKKRIIDFHGYSKGTDRPGNSIIQTLYKDEEMFTKWESKIGIKIPRSQEANTRWDENRSSVLRETFTEDLKIKNEEITIKQ